MKRPLSNIRSGRPIMKTLSPRDDELYDNEIRVLIGRLADSAEDNVETLEKLKSGEIPEELESDIISMVRFNRRTLDPAAQKLAAMHEKKSGRIPNSWTEYKKHADKRDELADSIN